MFSMFSKVKYYFLLYLNFATTPKIKKHKLYFTDLYKALGVSVWANWFPRRWEKYCSFIFPAMYVEVFLEVIKREKASNVLIDQYMY